MTGGSLAKTSDKMDKKSTTLDLYASDDKRLALIIITCIQEGIVRLTSQASLQCAR